ncbi:unnamed protein product [Soboliphyme baturini]|uniref:Uncharacterized protein n=1 Tax=Soboliphyme baturini TaxID=241478 RepID=A0A183IIM0_9BILA|nr:unnamed protein product [Soboliphyme baturini]
MDVGDTLGSRTTNILHPQVVHAYGDCKQTSLTHSKRARSVPGPLAWPGAGVIVCKAGEHCCAAPVFASLQLAPRKLETAPPFATVNSNDENLLRRTGILQRGNTAPLAKNARTTSQTVVQLPATCFNVIDTFVQKMWFIAAASHIVNVQRNQYDYRRKVDQVTVSRRVTLTDTVPRFVVQYDYLFIIFCAFCAQVRMLVRVGGAWIKIVDSGAGFQLLSIAPIRQLCQTEELQQRS